MLGFVHRDFPLRLLQQGEGGAPRLRSLLWKDCTEGQGLSLALDDVGLLTCDSEAPGLGRGFLHFPVLLAGRGRSCPELTLWHMHSILGSFKPAPKTVPCVLGLHGECPVAL